MFYTRFLWTFASGGQKWHIQCWQPTQKTCLNAKITKSYINRMPVPLRWIPFTEKTRMPHSLVNRWDFPLYLDALVLDNWIGGIFNKIWWSLHRLQISKYIYTYTWMKRVLFLSCFLLICELKYVHGCMEYFITIDACGNSAVFFGNQNVFPFYD